MARSGDNLEGTMALESLELEFVNFISILSSSFSPLGLLPLLACPSRRVCVHVRLCVCRILVLRAASSTLGLNSTGSSAGSASIHPAALRQASAEARLPKSRFYRAGVLIMSPNLV